MLSPSMSELDAATVHNPQSCTRSVSLAAVLDMIKLTTGHAVDADAPLMDSGVDSLGAVELRNQLQQAVGNDADLSDTFMFNHPTARFIAIALQPVATHTQVEANTPTLSEMSPIECDLPLGEILELLQLSEYLETFADEG